MEILFNINTKLLQAGNPNKLQLLLVIAWLSIFGSATAQDSIIYRTILIGDAGEINDAQSVALGHAAGNVLSGRTSVFFLGDNIYPRGVSLDNDANDAKILQSQFQPLRKAGAGVYFVPGNHDWDKSGVHGLEKIKREWSIIDNLGDNLLKLYPANGCPDPVDVPLAPGFVAILYDSEWWLYPYNKDNPGADCKCKTARDVLDRMNDLRFKYSGQTILVLSHHPFVSYGVHGGRFSWKDHIFPLRAINPNLYIPLPVIGSLYPFLRKALINPEDLHHPLYKELSMGMQKVFAGEHNVIFGAGHEHGLQLINGNIFQVVSGAGAKHSVIHHGKNSLFASSDRGYVTADLMRDHSVRLTYYTASTNGMLGSFTFNRLYTAPSINNEVDSSSRLEGDSITIAVHPSYDKPGRFHRSLFGENYRKDWATPVRLPVLHTDTMFGGLKPLELGGGMQSKSLRMEDKNGKEYVIRSVEKAPDALIPPPLRQTFARDIVDDVTSAQHPFSALSVPPIANALGVPHAHPIIGVVSPDPTLKKYSDMFKGLVVLFEEREPAGKSDNSEKMEKNLDKDNDNSLDGETMLRARILDALLGDWDRHEDQWRWVDSKKGSGKAYVAVPRDRDQVFHLTRGLFPKIASRSYILPTLRNFNEEMSHSRWLISKTAFVNAYPSMQFSRKAWDEIVLDATRSLTDSVLELSLKQLPVEIYHLRHEELLKKLKARRDRLPAVFDDYYRFIRKIVDIRVSDKNEFVKVTDSEHGMHVEIVKINKKGKLADRILDQVYDPEITKEVRIYLFDGMDSVIINTTNTPIKLRLIGGDDKKNYNLVSTSKKVRIYDKLNGSTVEGKGNYSIYRSNDSLNTAFSPVKLYHVTMPLLSFGINRDDGFLLGAGVKFTRQEGYKTFPYKSMHQITAAYSFSTNAFKIRHVSEWINAFGKADFTIHTQINNPNNTVNFFGRGNETSFMKGKDFITYFRTRFGTYRFDPAIRWRGSKGATISVGPSLYYYVYDADDNIGRLIENPSKIGSYDSLTVNSNKWHGGVQAYYVSDKRNNKIITQWGSYVSLRVLAYKGLNKAANDFAQIIPEVAVYRALDQRRTLVLAERFGGTVSIGKTAFYQSAFIGGLENLLGYRQYRFAGQHSFYNNLELRLKVADIGNYILPGQLGLTGFWDLGRVWEADDHSDQWHNGVGGGLYFAPASMLSVNLLFGYSKEGWFPYFTMGFRF